MTEGSVPWGSLLVRTRGISSSRDAEPVAPGQVIAPGDWYNRSLVVAQQNEKFIGLEAQEFKTYRHCAEAMARSACTPGWFNEAFPATESTTLTDF